MEKPKNLREVKGKKLIGYELITGYFLQLRHGLWGTFPALISEGDELFFCTDKQLLEKVWEKLPKRNAKVTEIELYANTEESIGFAVNIGDEAESVHILSEKELALLVDKPDSFKWASGLVQLKEEEVKSPFD